MKSHLIYILFVLLICPTTSLGQKLFHQDIYYGGVTAAGFSTGIGAWWPEDTITVNIRRMLNLLNVGEEYNVDDYCISFNGSNFEAGSSSNVVFSDEEEVIQFCTNYLWELREEEGDIISLSEARKEVVNSSNGSFKYS